MEARPAEHLTYMHILCIYMHMRTTINIDDETLKKAAELTGINEKTALVRRGLEALISLESAKRLAKLAGSEKALRPIPRRKSAP
jgi:Arc/MetJ family transcription regulator